jgi:hypothetical protein
MDYPSRPLSLDLIIQGTDYRLEKAGGLSPLFVGVRWELRGGTVVAHHVSAG